MSDALKEALKELSRNVVLAVIGFLLTEGVVNNAVDLVFGGRLTVEQRMTITVGVMFALRTLDKYIHEDKTTKANGLLPW